MFALFETIELEVVEAVRDCSQEGGREGGRQDLLHLLYYHHLDDDDDDDDEVDEE